jgi:Baseplate J-like protein
MVTYLAPPIETTSDDLAADAIDYLIANLPGFVPRDGHLEIWQITALARMVATSRDVASSVPLTIFRYYGESVIGLQPIDAVSATTATTWTMQDNAGYTIPAGTTIGFRVAGDTLIAFVTTDDVTVPAGSTVTPDGAVNVLAVDPGVAGNNLGGAGAAWELIDALSFVTDITSVSATGGGQDAETDEQYLGRLIDELALSSPRPIHANDFAVLARRIAGVARAVAVDGYNAQRVVVANTHSNNVIDGAAAGTFSSADVGRGITGAGIPGATTISAFVDDTHVTISANATATAAGVNLTLAAMTNQQRTVGVAVVDVDGQPLSAGVKASVVAYLESLREINFVVSVFDPTYTVVNVSFTISVYPTYVAETVRLAAVQAVTDYLSPKNWGLDPADTTSTSWTNDTTVRYLEVATLLNNVPGVHLVTALTVNGGVVDVALAGTVALPEPGAIVGTLA